MKRVTKLFKKKGSRKGKAQDEVVAQPVVTDVSDESQAAEVSSLPPPPFIQATVTPPLPPLAQPETPVAPEVSKVVDDVPKAKGPPMVVCPEGGDADFLTPAQHSLIKDMRLLIPKLHPYPVPPFVELCGDLRMLRFLEGYGNDVGAASEAYVGMLVWRGRNGMDEVRKRLVDNWNDDLHCYSERNFPNKSLVLKHLPLELNYSYSIPSKGRGGHIVTLEKTGQGDPAALLNELPLDDYIDFEKQNMEHKAILLDRRSREVGYLVKLIAIRDMAGLGIKHCGSRGVGMMTSVLKMMQGAYPEVIENIFMINAPWVFATLWSLVKPFVAPRTIEKIKIFSASDLNNAKTLLVNRIGADQLPLRYGGTRPDVTEHKPVPDTPLLSARPKDIPTISDAMSDAVDSGGGGGGGGFSNDEEKKEETRLEEEAEIQALEEKVAEGGPLNREVLEQLSPDAAAMTVDLPAEVKEGGNYISAPSSQARSEIAPKGNLMVELEVDMELGSSVAVSWTFRLHTYLATMDIGFSVSFQPKNLKEEAIMVKAFSRVPEESPDRSGSWVTNKPGTLTFTWDNSYSMFISKDVEYKIKVWEEREEGDTPRRRKLSFSKSESSSISSPGPDNSDTNGKTDDATKDKSTDKSSSSFGFDMSLPDISLSEYLSFSKSVNSSDKDNKNKQRAEESSSSSFWDSMRFSSSKKN